ncbi:hypothetical protein [Litoreibacter roseus]|uniref:Uncharacterized protein n=1 Tax=Litoreibacter roseus TaxID=2601869 RepID=A0A6N6JCV2_9RHOB|nr:hypothetical protein [Litoreibacter roseus]GFE63996.1 hypothetical protein KIN_10700 [Litoreibacter roseus]
MIIQALAGIILGLAVFGALMWSGYRAALTEGAVRYVNAALSVSTLLGMVAVTNNWPGPALIVGLGCALLGLIAVRYEAGWSRLLPLMQAIFGGALTIGLPWMGG